MRRRRRRKTLEGGKKNKIMEEGLIPLRRENNKIEGNIKTVEEEIQE